MIREKKKQRGRRSLPEGFAMEMKARDRELPFIAEVSKEDSLSR